MQVFAVKYHVPHESNDVLRLYQSRAKAEKICFRLNRREKYQALMSHARYVANWSPTKWDNTLLEFSPSDREFYVEELKIY